MIAYNAVIEGALNGGHRCCCYIYSVVCVCIYVLSVKLVIAIGYLSVVQ